MSNRSRGRRGSQGDGWTWDDERSGSEGTSSRRGRSPLVPILALVGLLAIIFAVVGVIVATKSGDGNGEQGAASSRSRTATATEAAQRTVVASSSPDTQLAFAFAAWSRSQRRWQTGDLDGADYREGEAIPIMIRIDNATRGDVYEIKLRYECAAGSANGFDFLSGLPAQEMTAPTVAPGPERARPDSTLPMPDDPSIPYDDGIDRRFRVWGGLFNDPPNGPVLATACEGDKRMSLTIRAQDDTIFLIIGAHFASAADWGEGKGASAGSTKLTLGGGVNDEPLQRIAIAPGTIRP